MSSMAQGSLDEKAIDPRLVEITEIVKARVSNPAASEKGSTAPTQDEVYLGLVDQMRTSLYTHDVEKITVAVEAFDNAYTDGGALKLSQISELYSTYAELLSADASLVEIQETIAIYTNSGNWFEKYYALSVAATTHAKAKERQAALQKAQLALSLIPTKSNPSVDAYITHAKVEAAALISHLHNLQGNGELALVTSLDYLRLTEDSPDLQGEVDLINNLIYSYSYSRNHEALLYLSEQLLEIEKEQSSSVPGLTEMRISGVMNSSGRFEEGLEYAERSIEQVSHPTVKRSSQVKKAIALAGLGKIDEARKMASVADVNLSPVHMLSTETRKGDLYLAFLLAQAEDSKYATQIFNRQLDVNAQKFFANNSRDTTAMLAELENSRERQAEREAATAREAELQAMTISRQRNLNRTLIVISILLALAAFAALLFTRFRGKVLRKLEIKTKEAASAEKLKTEFLGMISHELRTPLNGIIGISDYLANYHADADIRQKTGIVLKSGNELLTVVESLTDMARIDAGQLKLVPHDAELGESLAAIPENWTAKAKEKGLAFTHFIDPAITRHNVDAERLVQCVNILLANAIRFTDSGRVHMHVTASKTLPQKLTVVVADTGRGMTELVQSRLFTPFMQADTSRKRTHMGTGLNLAIAYALVEMMGGKLSCVSRAERGSEFTFNIPLHDALSERPAPELIEPSDTQERLAEAQTEESAIHPSVSPTSVSPTSVSIAPVLPPPVLAPPVMDTAASPDRDYVDLMMPATGRAALHDSQPPASKVLTDAEVFSRSQQRVLIVDDMDGNRDVLRLILESKGHICGEAADGFAALAALERKSYDVIILDIHMAPLDGIETLRRLRNSGKSYANITVIVLTADNAPSINAETMDAGADLFLTKPIRREDLLDAMAYLNAEDRGRILSQRA